MGVYAELVLSLPYPVVLASKSPRRVEILRELIGEFVVDPADVDEDSLTTSNPWETAEQLSEHKAVCVFERHPHALVIGGDTVVALTAESGYEMLGKPASGDEAVAMLQKLSGRSHLVVTGICLVWPGGRSVFSDTTTVRFRAVADAEIDEYVATGDPMDKAGGYAIQGMAGKFIESINGSYSNVVGVPKEKLEQALAAFTERSPLPTAQRGEEC